jgi:hypothetical protein
MKLRWRFGVLAGIFLAIFCLYPQFKMFYLRGGEWNGHYAYNDIDEVAYASYVRALVDGRPRAKTTLTPAVTNRPETPQPESLFSIQFAAPYTIAIPARVFGIGTPWAMTIAGAIAGFLAAFAAFWFIGRLTGDNWYAMAASLAVFCFGTLAAGEGAVLEIFFDGFSYPYFPGFRRYIPALAMPAFFGFVAMIWKLVGVQRSAVSGQQELTNPKSNNPKSKIDLRGSRRPVLCILRLFVLSTSGRRRRHFWVAWYSYGLFNGPKGGDMTSRTLRSSVPVACSR